MILSVLICTIQGRETLFSRLLQLLNNQAHPDVEILFEKDNKEITTGEKRNILLERASGEYCCFVDDDDLVCPNYVSRILDAVQTRPDCVGFTGQISFAKQGIQRDFIHSLQYSTWFTRDNVYYRCPNHLNPVRTELARAVGYKPITVSEDSDFSNRLFPLLKTCVDIPKPHLYFYLTG